MSRTCSTCQEMSSVAGSTRKGRFHVSSDCSVRRVSTASVSSASVRGRICVNVEVTRLCRAVSACSCCLRCCGKSCELLATCACDGWSSSSSIGDSRTGTSHGGVCRECFLLLVHAQSQMLLGVAGHLRDQRCTWERSFLRDVIVICVNFFWWCGGRFASPRTASSNARGFALRRCS